MLILAIVPNSSLTGLGKTNDKILHFFEFLVFAMILFTTLHYFNVKKLILKGLTISFGVILISEVVQLLSVTRSFSVYDMVADLIGVFLAMVIFYFSKK